MARDSSKATDMGSRLDIIRNTPMDPIMKLEILQKMRAATDSSFTVSDSLSASVRKDAARGYDTRRVGGDKTAVSGSFNFQGGPGSPQGGSYSGNRTSRFIVG